MSTLTELDYLLAPDPVQVVKSYQDRNAMGQRIRHWLDTPVGTVADMPSWGHPLALYKHEPASENLRVMAEMSIFEKLIADVRNTDIRSVSVDFPEIDRMNIVIVSGDWLLEKQVVL